MTAPAMTSLERVMTALSHREPDRTPLFLLFSHYGAKEMGMSIREYFRRPDRIAEAQRRLRDKFDTDCLYGFLYGPLEVEAWGGEVIFADDGPPNAGQPFIRSPAQIRDLDVPKMDVPCLGIVLDTLRRLRDVAAGEAPVIGVVMSPFSLPVMQMGFEPYLRLIYEEQELFERLMRVNSAFCVAWANAQIEAGANAICYFDPLASTDMIPLKMYRRSGFSVARDVISRINGPTATHLASARASGAADLIAETGATILGFSCQDEAAALKRQVRGKLSLLGALNGVAMRRWTPEETEATVRALIRSCAPGGGFLLADNHGEIPWHVKEETLFAVRDAVRQWGRYPISGEC